MFSYFRYIEKLAYYSCGSSTQTFSFDKNYAILLEHITITVIYE